MEKLLALAGLAVTLANDQALNESQTCLLQTFNQKKNGNYHFGLYLKWGPGVQISGPAFAGGDDSIYGCGSDNSKCQCTYLNGGFQMIGWGTDGTATGLDFRCKDIKFTMKGYTPSECTCNFRASLNHYGNGRDFQFDCNGGCFKFVDYDGSGDGSVHDLMDRFINVNGGGEDTISWDFHVMAEASGTATSLAQLAQSPSSEKALALPSLESANGDYHFGLYLKAGPGVTISGDSFKGGDDSVYGCGSDDSKCKCAYYDNEFQMIGYGTDGTATGLEFWCKNVKFSMPSREPSECTCNFRASLNHYGSGRDFQQQCTPFACYELVDYDAPGDGKVTDLIDRFINPNGGGDGIVSWDFHIQADVGGDPKPDKSKDDPVVLGAWKAASSGASMTFKQSITWSESSSHKDAHSVSEALTAGTKFSYSSTATVGVPGVDSAETSWGVEVALSSTTSWSNSIEDTMTSTNGGSQEITCAPAKCEGGTSYQWVTSVDEKQDWGALFSSCIFVCMPNQGQRPQCPYGTCCTADLTDQCSKCSQEWCDKADPECPFSDPNFKIGCD